MKYNTLTYGILAILVITLFSGISITMSEAKTNPTLSIVFDDGRTSQYQYAFPAMRDRGMHGTFYVITDDIGTSGHMGYDELHTLIQYGNQIGSHGKTHSYMVGKSEAWLRNEYAGSLEALRSHDIDPKDLAFPYGGYDTLAVNIAKEYYRSVRSAYDYPCSMNTPYPYLLLSAAGEANGDALGRLKIMVDRLALTSEWNIYFFHNVLPNVESKSGTINLNDFIAFLNYVNSKGIRVLTIDEVLSGTSIPTPAPTATPSPTPTVLPSILPTPTPTPDTGTNLLLNSNIEIDNDGNNIPDNWKFYKTSQMNAIGSWISMGYYSNKCLSIQVTNVDTTTQQSALWYQSITTIKVGETYGLKCWYNSNVQSKLILIAYGGQTQLSVTWLNLPSTNGNWIESNDLYITLPTGTTSLRVDVRVFNGVGSGIALFDNLEVT